MKSKVATWSLLVKSYCVVPPVVWCGEEDVVEPEGRVHQGNLNPVLTLGGGRREEEGGGGGSVWDGGGWEGKAIDRLKCLWNSTTKQNDIIYSMTLCFALLSDRRHPRHAYISCLPCCQSSHQKSIPSLSLSPITMVSQLVTNCKWK